MVWTPSATDNNRPIMTTELTNAGANMTEAATLLPNQAGDD